MIILDSNTIIYLSQKKLNVDEIFRDSAVYAISINNIYGDFIL